MRILPACHWGTLFLSAIALADCSPKLAPTGHYQDTPVTADGNPADWTLPLRFSNTAYTLQYNVTNDDTNLYVCVSSADEATQFRILRSGMTLYFDPKGDKNKDVSIHYPIRKQPDPGAYHRSGGDNNTYYSRQNNTNTSGASRDARKEELLLQSDYYNTTGFSGLENGQFGATDTKTPIRLAMKLDNDDSLLVYEVAIPLKDILGAGWTAKAANKNFSVGIVLDAVTGTGGNGGGMRPGGMGMHGMGMGGMHGGMGGGGHRYGGGQPAQPADASWYTFRLAVK